MSIREQIARKLYFGFVDYKEGSVAEVVWRKNGVRQAQFMEKADQILAIEGLEERCENQELPEIEQVYEEPNYCGGYFRSQQDMLKGDNSGYWVKVKRR